MAGSWWWDLLLGIAAGLLLAWVVLIVALVIVRPRGGLLREALRLLPDVLRLLPRLAADRRLPRGVRVRLALLLVYLASPIDLVPDFIPVLGYADDAIIVAAVLRSVVRHAGIEAIERHWPGTHNGFAALCRVTGLTPHDPAVTKISTSSHTRPAHQSAESSNRTAPDHPAPMPPSSMRSMLMWSPSRARETMAAAPPESSCLRAHRHVNGPQEREWTPIRCKDDGLPTADDQARTRRVSAASSRLKRSGSSRCGDVTDAVVPGRLGGRAGGEDVLGHRRQHDRVRPALRDEQRHLERAQHVVAVDLAGGEIGADRGRHDDVPAHRRLEVVVRHRLHDTRAARTSAWPRCWSAGRRRWRPTKWSRKPGPISVPKAASPSLTAPSTKSIAAIRSWP